MSVNTVISPPGATPAAKPNVFSRFAAGIFNNPIIHREVLTSLRTKKAVAMQGLFLLVVAALVWLYWPETGLQDLGGQQARQIFSILAIGELLMVIMFAPAFTAASLTVEKEHGTFESVFSTAMKPWEIAIGKMLGSLTFLLLLVLSGVPALAAPFLMGGVSGAEVLRCLALLLLTAVFLGMIGLLVSAFMSRSYRAIIVTYGILGVITFLCALPAWPITRNLVNRPDSEIGRGILHTIASLSPLEAMLSVVWPNSNYSTGAQGMPEFWLMYIILSIVCIVGVAIVCLVRLHSPVAPPRPREKLKIVERGQISARTFLFLVDPRKRKNPIFWWQNPVLIKEFRTRPMLQAQWMLRGFGVAAIGAVLLMIGVAITFSAIAEEGTNMVEGMITAVSSLMVVLVVLIGPAMSGGTICGDVETGVWDLMRTTKLSSWRIVSGKFQAAIIPMLLLMLAMVPALVILVYFGDNWNMITNIIRVLYVVFMTVAFVATAGMCFSSLFLRTSTATAWTYAVVITLGLLTLLVMLGEDRFSPGFRAWVYTLNPVAAALDASGKAVVKGDATFTLWVQHLKVMGTATVVMIVVTVLRVLQLRRAD